MKYYFVHALRSERDGNLFIRFTRNVFRRLNQHNSGQSPSTATRRPFTLIYFEAHLSKTDAIRRESYCKTTAGRRTLKLMLREFLKDQAGREGKMR